MRIENGALVLTAREVLRVQAAAARRLDMAEEHLHDGGSGDDLAAPYCGCTTCTVREVLDAGLGVLGLEVES